MSSTIRHERETTSGDCSFIRFARIRLPFRARFVARGLMSLAVRYERETASGARLFEPPPISHSPLDVSLLLVDD
jgi:hypothetical protein